MNSLKIKSSISASGTPAVDCRFISPAPRGRTRPAISRRALLAYGCAAFAGRAPLVARAVGRREEQESPASATLVHDDVARLMDRARLAMLYEGKSADECRAWQEKFGAKLNELLGDSAPPEEWTAREVSRHDFTDHVRYGFMLTATGIPSVPVYLLTPHTTAPLRRHPAVVCIHGHGPFGNDPIVGHPGRDGVEENIRQHNYDYGLQFVRRGYVVAAPCMIPFGRRVARERYGGNDPCAVTFVRMQAAGRLPIAANLRDLRWTVDWLESRSEVQPGRIGCAGLSYGGRMTMMLSALDRRVRVAAVSGALNLMQERMTLRHSCGSQMIPGLLKYGDYSEIGSLIAPRPCIWETGSRDALIVPRWDEVFRTRLRRAYASFGALDKLFFDSFEGGHAWSGRVAYQVFDEVLKA